MDKFSAVIMGKRLKLLRGEKSQDAVAKAIGISRGALSFYENGERKPDAEAIFKICQYYNISADSLLGLGESKRKCIIPGRFLNAISNLDEYHIGYAISRGFLKAYLENAKSDFLSVFKDSEVENDE